ncbi:MAG: transcriptional regulator [Gammaproteobacteria bacterium GWE2_42_36]|nr:MAG: transcriptional regulator [Gammaproteobacteria bacterium GWE2_42_36]HCU05642.1 transcriptional regulator [Coxiellaceae bacterium]
MDKTILEVVHESAKGLYDAGLLDLTTMRKFDDLCLPAIRKMKSKDIKRIRLQEKISQPVLARYLNVSASAVKHWESGDKNPSGAALKLLNLIEQKGLEILI